MALNLTEAQKQKARDKTAKARADNAARVAKNQAGSSGSSGSSGGSWQTVTVTDKKTGVSTVTTYNRDGTKTTSNNSAYVPWNAPTLTSKDKRRQERDAFTGWDNNPEVRKFQEEAWEIYINTGQWNTARQKQLHDMAEDARKAANPLYPGLPWGPSSASEAAQYFLPGGQFPSSSFLEGNIGGIAIIGIMGLAVISFLRG